MWNFLLMPGVNFRVGSFAETDDALGGGRLEVVERSGGPAGPVLERAALRGPLYPEELNVIYSGRADVTGAEPRWVRVAVRKSSLASVPGWSVGLLAWRRRGNSKNGFQT